MLKVMVKNNLNQLSNNNNNNHKNQAVCLSRSNNWQVRSHSKVANKHMQRPDKRNKCVTQAKGNTIAACGTCPNKKQNTMLVKQDKPGSGKKAS